MEYKIERAKYKHLKEIQHLNKLLFDKEIVDFDETLNPEWTLSKEGEKYFKEAITKECFTSFVALVGNKVVGYLVGEILEEPITWRTIKNQAELDNMFVLPEHRDKKIGSALVKAFIKEVRKKGIKNIKVVAYSGNQKAISFYRKHGFQDYDLTLEVNY